MNLIPVVIDKEINGERSYDIYSRLLKERIIFISGEINDNLANTVIAELLYLDSINHDDISIYINSPGGVITAGMAIYDTMQFIKSDVVTICMGMAASMAAFLLSSGTIGKRFILPHADVMIHQPLGGAEGQATDIKIACDRILNLRNRLNNILAENTGKKLEDEFYNEFEEDDKMLDLEPITCPYCEFKFLIEYDLDNSEIKCPECDNLIQLDWEEYEEDM